MMYGVFNFFYAASAYHYSDRYYLIVALILLFLTLILIFYQQSCFEIIPLEGMCHEIFRAGFACVVIVADNGIGISEKLIIVRVVGRNHVHTPELRTCIAIFS